MYFKKIEMSKAFPIRNHHCDETELNFHIFWQLLSASVCWVHSDEDPKLRIHLNHISVDEDELSVFVFLAGENHRDLLGRHREDGRGDPVELIETSPGP